MERNKLTNKQEAINMFINERITDLIRELEEKEIDIGVGKYWS